MDPGVEATSTHFYCDSICKVTKYYDETIEDYLHWSPQGYMHYGLWHRRINPLNRRAMLEAMNDEVFSQLNLDSTFEKTIGDLGCGIGAVTRYGAARYPQHQWHGLSISKGQVDFANRSATHLRMDHSTQTHLSNWSVSNANYHCVPWKDQSLHAAYFLESLCYSENLGLALSEAYRLLEPRGRLGIADGLLKIPLQKMPSHSKFLARTVSADWAVPGFHLLDELIAVAQRVGFKVVWQRELSWQLAPSVIHSPFLIGSRALSLCLQGKTTKAWQWRHLRASLLAMLLGFHRNCFGYFYLVFEKPAIAKS